MRQKLKPFILYKTRSFFCSPRNFQGFIEKELIININATYGKFSQNWSKAAEFFNNHFGNLKLLTRVSESECDLLTVNFS